MYFITGYTCLDQIDVCINTWRDHDILSIQCSASWNLHDDYEGKEIFNLSLDT